MLSLSEPMIQRSVSLPGSESMCAYPLKHRPGCKGDLILIAHGEKRLFAILTRKGKADSEMQFNSASAAARVSGTPVTMVVCMRGGEAWAGNALNRLNAQTEFRQRVRRIQLSHTPISRTKGIPLNGQDGQAAPPARFSCCGFQESRNVLPEAVSRGKEQMNE